MSVEETTSIAEQLFTFFTKHQDDIELSDETIKKLCTHLVDHLNISTFSDLRDVMQDDIPIKILKLKQRKKVLECISRNVTLRDILQMEDGPPSELLSDFIKRCGLSNSAELTLGDFLEDELECSTISNLKENEIGKGDIEVDVSVVEINRFLRLFNEEFKGQPKKESLVTAKRQVPEQVLTTADNSCSITIQAKSITVQYVHYNNPLKTKGVTCTTINNIIPETTSMLDLILQIMKSEGTDASKFTLEVFSSKGYPLNTNVYTNQCTLQKWNIGDQDILYVFTRKKKQSGEYNSRSLPLVHHLQGDAEVEVSTQLHGTVKIRIDSADESPEDFCKKMYSATDVSTTNMSLYLRDSNTSQCTEVNVNSQLKPGDTLTMLLKSPSDEALKYATEYGRSSYTMIVIQSDRGMSAFLSILRFLCEMQKSTIDFSKFLALVLEESHCPPLVYALKVLYENHCCSLPCWVAIMEGCFVLMKEWLSSFTDDGRIPDNEVFEFSDYFWAALLKSYLEKEQSLRGAPFETTRKSFICPISKLKMVTPVRVASQDGDDIIYDRQSAIEKKVSFEDDEEMTELLMLNPWKSNLEIIVWNQQLPIQQTNHDKLVCPYEWYEMVGSLDVLHVSVPSHLLGMGSLTFIENGRYVLYMGFAKDNDSGQMLYDPLESKLVRRRKDHLCDIAKKHKNENVATRDLTKVVSDEKLHTMSGDVEEVRPKPIKAEYGSNWTPQEAVMVIVDVSGSMRNKAYDGFTRLEVAKELFGAFRLRTQAYDLPNAVGLLSFGSYVTCLLELKLCSDEFEKALSELTINGVTALNDAMKKAADYLTRFESGQKSLTRRILCLTDGYEYGSSAPYTDSVVITSYLLERGIIVDTVLIDNSSNNVEQKAISHATGGSCFMPNSLVAGLKLFEMEAFLSFNLRDVAKTGAKSISGPRFAQYKDPSRYPFDKALPCNALIEPLPKTSFKIPSIGAQDLEQSRLRRIVEELKKIKKSSQNYLEVFPCESDISVWLVLMKGPEYTPYSTGAFLLQVQFPDKYPSQPPLIRFHQKTPIYHCNINSTGRICHSILSESYCTRFDMKDILGSIYHLLMCPEEDDPLDSVIGYTLKCSRKEYMKIAKEQTEKSAIPLKHFDTVKQNLSSGKDPMHV